MRRFKVLDLCLVLLFACCAVSCGSTSNVPASTVGNLDLGGVPLNVEAEKAASDADPLESINRPMAEANSAIFNLTLKPVGFVYTTVVPPPLRAGVDNALENVEEPRVFVDDLLQGRFGAAKTTFGRFLVNSTVGIGGLFDVATPGGLPRQSGDFGQTLYQWGVPSGPYIVLPLLGPSNPRDGIGNLVDSFGDPVGYSLNFTVGAIPGFSMSGLRFMTKSGMLEEVETGSIDSYQRLRSAYVQSRQEELLKPNRIAKPLSLVPKSASH